MKTGATDDRIGNTAAAHGQVQPEGLARTGASGSIEEGQDGDGGASPSRAQQACALTLNEPRGANF